MTGVTNVPIKLLGMVQRICRWQINLYGIVDVAIVMLQTCLQNTNCILLCKMTQVHQVNAVGY
ncbi:unnamed protein product [Brassica rapa subsp. trilocularis]